MEFGVAETKALIKILEENRLQQKADDFLQLALDSQKWKKWMLPETTATDRDRSIIAGHYIFSTGRFLEIKKEASTALEKMGLNLDATLKEAVKSSIMRYLINFRMVRSA